MKIAWFTPFTSTSAIGKVSKQVCVELSKSCYVDIWTSDTSNLIETNLNVVNFNSEIKLDKLDRYDHIIYNIGNYAGNHKDIYELGQKKPGIIILHDQTMHSFWGQYYLMPEFGGSDLSLSKYQNLVSKYYGDIGVEVLNQAFKAKHYPIYDYPNMDRMKLVEPILENAKGVFTHSSIFANELTKIFSGDIGYAYLPHQRDTELKISEDNLSEHIDFIKSARTRGKKILLSTGIVHPVKRIDKVVEALLISKRLADEFVYVVIGGYGGEYGDKLLAYSTNELKDTLSLLGYQSDEIMNFYLENSDMCINLRYPNSEVCSLSLIEQMSHEKPTMVINSGIYSEMPDDSVVKIEIENEIASINEVLTQFSHKDTQFKLVGKKALEFINQECTVEKYCEKLISFLSKYEIKEVISKYEKNLIRIVGYKLDELGYSFKDHNTTFDSIVTGIDELMNHSSKTIGSESNQTLALWFGFKHHIPNLHREGISRFAAYLVDALLRNFSIDVEVWCYEVNLQEIEQIYSVLPVETLYSERIKMITECNWTERFNVNEFEAKLLGDVNLEMDNLNIVARKYSKADCFIPVILYLDNVVGVDRNIFVPAHDMAVAEHYYDFIEKDSLFKARYLDINSRVENLARIGKAKFFSNCNYVRENQILRHIKNARIDRTNVVYLPVNLSESVLSNILPEIQVRQLIGTSEEYLFYPTQIRPYKNIITLLRAFRKLLGDFPNLILVLTGNPNDMPEIAEYIAQHKLEAYLKLISDVTENELYSIYKYAAAVPVTSKFEGGFPWQACEALYMEVPLVLSRIPVVIERINYHGFSEETCNINLYETMNVDSLYHSLVYVLNNRESVIKAQNDFRYSLLSYDWNEAAKCYLELFFSQGEGV